MTNNIGTINVNGRGILFTFDGPNWFTIQVNGITVDTQYSTFQRTAYAPILAPVNVVVFTVDNPMGDSITMTVNYMDSITGSYNTNGTNLFGSTAVGALTVTPSLVVNQTRPNIMTPLITLPNYTPAGITTNPWFTDYYGRAIRVGVDTQDHLDVANAILGDPRSYQHTVIGQRVMRLKMKAGESMPFYKFQGYAEAPPVTNITFRDSMIIANDDAIGEYLFRVVTDIGYIDVTISISVSDKFISLGTFNMKGNGVLISFPNGDPTEFHVWVNENPIPTFSMGTDYAAPTLVAPVNRIVVSPNGDINNINSVRFVVNYMDSLTTVHNTQIATATAFTSDSNYNSMVVRTQVVPPIQSIRTPMIIVPTAGLTLPFVDYYGRTIFTTIPMPQTTTGQNVMNIEMKAGSSMPFYKVQGYGTTPTTDKITFHNGFIIAESDADGSNYFQVITEIGYIDVNITMLVDLGAPTEIIHHVYKGQDYQIPNLVVVETLTIDANNSIVNGLINMNRSMKVNYNGFRYNIVVLPVPTSLALTVLLTVTPPGYPYNLYELFNIPTYFEPSDIQLFEHDNTPIVIGDPLVYKFTNSTALGALKIKVLQYQIGTVNTVLDNIKRSSVFAILGKSFDLGDHIHPLDGVSGVKLILSGGSTTTNSSLYNVSDTRVTMLRLDFSGSEIIGLEVEALINGTVVTILLDMTVISANTVERYLTSFQNVFPALDNQSIRMITSEGAEITITQADVIINPYSTTVCDVRIISGHFQILPKRSCLFLGKIGGVGSSVLLNPIDPISTTQIYTRSVPGIGGSKAIHLNLPHGPTYNIEDSSQVVGTFTGGAADVPISTSDTNLTITLPNYDDGTTTIPLRVVKAQTRRIGFIHQRTVAYTYLSPTTSGGAPVNSSISLLGGNITVSRSADTFDEIIAQEGTTYLAIQFYELPAIKKDQISYYSETSMFQDVLPTIGYEFNNVNNSMVHVNGQFRPTEIISTYSSPPIPVISFNYGEIQNGMIKLIKFNGKSVLSKIFKRVVINGIGIRRAIHDTDLNLTTPFLGPGYKIVHTGSGGNPEDINPTSPIGDPNTDEIHIVVDDNYVGSVNIPEFFITTAEHAENPNVINTANSQLTLYSFETLPKLSHDTVYVLSGNNWIPDVDCRSDLTSGATTYLKNVGPGPDFTNTSTRRLYFNMLSGDYVNYGLTLQDIDITPSFLVHHLTRHLGDINVVEGYNQVLEFDEYNSTVNNIQSIMKLVDILSFGTEPENMKSFNTRVLTNQASAVVEADEASLRITARSVGKTTIYMLANVEDQANVGTIVPDQFVALEVITHARPYASSVSLEFFDDANLANNLELIPSSDEIIINVLNGVNVFVTTDLNSNPTVVSGLTKTGSLTLKQGTNTISYSYYGIPDLKTVFNVKVFKEPGTFNPNHTMRVSESVEIDLVQDLFGETAGYVIQNIQPTDVTLPASSGTPPAGPSFLTAVRSSNNKKVTLTTGADDNMTTQTYLVSITISVPNTSLTLPPVDAIVQLSVVIWNPKTVKKGLILQSTSSTSIEVSIPTVMSITEKLVRVVNNGMVLYDSSGNSNQRATSHKALSWEKYSSGYFDVRASARTLEQYFMYTSADVYLIVVILLDAIPKKTVFIPSSGATPVDPSSGGTFDLLDTFLPSMRDQLVELGINTDGGTLLLNEYALTVGNGQQVELKTTVGNFSPVRTIATFNFDVTEINNPTAIGTNLTFVTPIGKVFKIKSTEVSYDSVLTCNSFDETHVITGGVTIRNKATNVSDGIELYFGATEDQVNSTNSTSMYSINCTLIRQGITELPITISVLAYNPDDTTEVPPITIYTPVLVLPVFPIAIRAYIFEGTNYGLRQSTNIKVSQVSPSAPFNMITVTVDKEDPRIAFTVQTEDGKFYIYEINYAEPHPTNAKLYLYEGGLIDVKPEDVTTVDAAQPLNLEADLSTLELSGGRYYAISESGQRVGEVQNTVGLYGSIVRLIGESVGIWANLQLKLKKGSSTQLLMFRPHVETLGSPVVQPQDIAVEINSKIGLNLSNYILNNTTDSNGLSNFGFKDWTVTWLSSIAAVGTLPAPLPGGGLGPFTPEGTMLVSSSLTTSGTYVLESNVIDRRRPVLASGAPTDYKLTITVVVMEDSINSVIDLLIIGTQKQEVNLESEVNKIMIGSASISIPMTGEVTLGGISFRKGKDVSGSMPNDPNYMTIHALVTNLQPLSILVFTKNGKRKILNVTQVKSLKDISMSAFEYIGSAFSSSSGSVVQNFIYNNAVILPGMYTTGLPIGQYINILPNGQYDIKLKEQTTITITYRTSNSVINSTLNLEVNGQEHKIVNIERLPPPVLDLGGSPIKIQVQGTALVESTIVDLGYAKISYRGEKLYVTDVTTNFDDTLVQWEIETDTKFIVESTILALSETTNEQIKYRVPAGGIITFILPYIPFTVTYDTMTLVGADDSFDIFGRVSRKKIGNVTISGQSIEIVASSDSDLTQPIGISRELNGKEIQNYFTIEVFKTNSTSFQQQGVNTTITSADLGNLNVKSVGALEAPYNVVVPTQLNFENKLNVFTGSVEILNFVPTSPFKFYIMLEDNSIRFYEIGYVEREIFVSNITRIPLAAITTRTFGISFAEPTVTLSGTTIMNPNSLHVITMTAPKYVKILLYTL